MRLSGKMVQISRAAKQLIRNKVLFLFITAKEVQTNFVKHVYTLWILRQADTTGITTIIKTSSLQLTAWQMYQ